MLKAFITTVFPHGFFSGFPYMPPSVLSPSHLLLSTIHIWNGVSFFSVRVWHKEIKEGGKRWSQRTPEATENCTGWTVMVKCLSSQLQGEELRWVSVPSKTNRSGKTLQDINLSSFSQTRAAIMSRIKIVKQSGLMMHPLNLSWAWDDGWREDDKLQRKYAPKTSPS